MKREQFLPYGQQSISEEDIRAVVDILKSPYLTTGPTIARFEQSVADYVGAKYAVAFSNGTAALHGACYAADIGAGDEVITTPITFAASANCVRYMNGTVVFADIDPKTYNIDPKDVLKKITPQTKAIIGVDFTGQVCAVDELRQIADEHNLVFIQDGAHSLGADYKGVKIGSQADMTMFSFHPVKPVTTAEGGVITTNNVEYYERLRLFRTHGISAQTDYAMEQGAWYYEMLDLGYNYRMTDMQAALGLSQMSKLDQFIEKRRQLANKYNELLADVKGVAVPYQAQEQASGWHLYSIQVEASHIDRKQLFEGMRAANIGVHVHYIPVYWFPYYKALGYKRGLCPVAEKWYEGALTLPLFPKMELSDVEEVVTILNTIV